MSEKLNLFEKIQAVSNEVKNIEKNMEVGQGKYSYKAVSDQDVTLAVKEAETKFRIVSIPVKQELLNTEIIKLVKKNGDEGVNYVDNIKMTIKIVDLDDTNQFIEVESFGKGVDTGDKGFGKAATYARKYALLNAYKIATGEDPDANKSVEQTGQKSISEKRKIVIDYLSTDNNLMVQALQHFNVAEADDLSESDINKMYLTYKKRGVI